MCKKVLKEKEWLPAFYGIISSFIVPTSATPDEVDRESVQKNLGFWMGGRGVVSGSVKSC